MAKKDFTKQHSFFTDNTPQIEKEITIQPTPKREVTEGYKSGCVEVKSKRVQLVFQPSIYERAKAKATQQNLSLNEYIHRLIDADTK